VAYLVIGIFRGSITINFNIRLEFENKWGKA
ncbi:unnamed protein product, partial [marine sediment metagenome]